LITAVDTNVLVDVFRPDPKFGPSSQRAVREAISEGSLMACDVVWAEVAGRFPSSREAERAMEMLGVKFAALDPEVALAAGDALREYRVQGGSGDRAPADFLIGAHAALRADRFLTRDRGFYRAYFKRIRLLDPSRA